jgi:hypothetical protein
MTAKLATRFVPAIVSGAEIRIECPTWCTVDHVADPEGHLVDVEHSSDFADLSVPREGEDDTPLVFARISSDPHSPNLGRRRPFVSLNDFSEGFEMSPDQADVFAESLEAFAAQVREMARIARGVSQ